MKNPNNVASDGFWLNFQIYVCTKAIRGSSRKATRDFCKHKHKLLSYESIILFEILIKTLSKIDFSWIFKSVDLWKPSTGAPRGLIEDFSNINTI